MPDADLTDQLDRAAVPLRDAVAGSRPPGAAAAITTARRRRATTGLAAGAAVLALVGGGLALTGGPDGTQGRGLDPAQTPSDAPRALPAPTPLTPATVDAATAGWLEGWRASETSDDSLFEGCLDGLEEAGLPEPVDDADVSFRTGQTGAFNALAVMSDDATAREWEQVLGSSLAECAVVIDGIDYRDDASSGATIASVTHLRRADTGTEFWVARAGERIAFAAVGPAEPATSDAGLAYGEALLAGLLGDAAFAEG